MHHSSIQLRLAAACFIAGAFILVYWIAGYTRVETVVEPPTAPKVAAPIAEIAPTAVQIVLATAAPIAPTTIHSATPEPTIAAVGDAYPCQAGQIKGNRQSHIFHAPGQLAYARTQRDVACFESEAAAIAAGYRKAQR